MVALGSSMASAVDPWAVQSRIGLTDARLALDSVLMPRPNLSYIDYRSGVMASGDAGTSHMAMLVKPAASGLAVTVEMGNCVINTPGMGAYMCALDSVKTLNLAASSATTNRIDLIVARVYDDLNPALASASGVRKFAVEIWTGDPATGIPTRPVPTVNAGWHPLAEVRVNKNATTISASDITDLRGPALVARGGMRSLYGADAEPTSDAYAEPGAYPGDQRWVHTSGFQHQVYYGAGQGWRGVHNAQVFNANPPAGERKWVLGAGRLEAICSVTIPDPGVPYMIFPTGRLAVLQSPGTAVHAHIKLTKPDGPAVNWVGDDTGNVNADTNHVYSIPPLMFGELTGSTSVYLTAQVIASPNGGGFGYRGSDTGHNLLSVVVYPSTVQPPGTG
ncbi:hypothetical protein [Saccharopolyspora spinosa]|uniref:Uncharacterized protein n=1 Tax=Saccharopolyspora spinosa TaxID=60894 RepID=A0A2N3XZ33_SACSN|nr:hypothetical protein [Saccharopolyspora spinosa]PKW15918.1 hypothetical protein A8926_3700 [Saccharopolyspora spinosa]